MKITDLLAKFREGACTAEELKVLSNHFGKGDDAAVEKWLHDDWISFQESQGPVATGRMWARIVKTLRFRQRRVAMWQGAAALLIALVVSVWWYHDAVETHTSTAYENETGVPARFLLPDGSSVWLNDRSTMKVDIASGRLERWIELQGEAFFEVVKDPDRPFVVRTGKLLTRVHGTSFNVKAYPADSLVEVSLVEGQVQVDLESQDLDTSCTNLLSPSEKLIFDDRDDRLSIDMFGGDEPYRWIGKIAFLDGASLEEVAELLQRIYQVRCVIHQHDLPASQIVYRLDAGRYDLQTTLTHLTAISDFQFVEHSNLEIHIKPK